MGWIFHRVDPHLISVKMKPFDFIVGTWNLVSFYVVKQTDTPSKERYPFGLDAMGRIIYSTDGYMNATLSHRERAPFSSMLEQSHLASREEKEMAFDTYMNYTGSYQIFLQGVQRGIIEHHVDMAFNPSTIGSIQRRHFKILQNGMLNLSYDWESIKHDGNIQYTFQLLWKK
jgi:hypothetical protein